MLPATLSTYGGPYSESEPVEDPTTQMASDEFNRLLEDHAQVTRGVMRAWVSFETIMLPPPEAVTVKDATSVWGDGSAQHPLITKTGTGVYEIEYAATYQDDLGFNEPVSLRFGGANIADAVAMGTANLVVASSQQAIVYLRNDIWLPSDFGGSVEIQVWLR